MTLRGCRRQPLGYYILADFKTKMYAVPCVAILHTELIGRHTVMAKGRTPRFRLEVGGKLFRECLRNGDDQIQASCRAGIDHVLGDGRGQRSDHKKAPKNSGKTATAVFTVRDPKSTSGQLISLGTYSVSSREPETVERVIAAIPAMLEVARQRSGVAI